jgi:esterase
MKLFVRRFGQGFPVIILHGLLGLSDNWVSLGRRLAAEFDVIIPDLRNHGQSPHSNVFDYPALVEDLSELTEDLGLGDFYLVGHSLGGKVSMQYALQYPQKLKKLVIVDISLGRYTTHTQQQQLIDAMGSVDFSSAFSRSDIEQQLSQTVPDIHLRQFLLKNAYWIDKKHLGWRINLHAINENLPAIFEGIESVGKFMKPALFIRGGLSDYVPEEDLPAIMNHFPLAEIHTIEKASHWVHADAPEEFFSLVNDFLSS